MTVNIVILAVVTLQRLGELYLSRRNTSRLLAQGAREHAPGHYPLIVALHAAWLACLWLFGLKSMIDPFWLALFVITELTRIWTLASLGPRWTTRIIVLPDVPLVRRGPYRWLNHPNYWIVVAEIAIFPLVFGLWKIALIFSILNGALLSVRIREENRALRS